MKYTIYQTTNLINNKIYIGKHKTDDPNDNYLGSGKYITAAIRKYGIENFKKEILHIFDSEEEMNAKEAELVTEEFCSYDTNYNLCPGGHGGWGYVNSNNLNFGGISGATKGAISLREKRHADLKFDIDYKEKIKSARANYKTTFSYEVSKLGAKAAQSEEAKQKRKLTREKTKFQQKENNSQYGKKRIKNLETLEHASVHPHMLDYWLSQGWILGKLPNGVGKYVPLNVMIENMNI